MHNDYGNTVQPKRIGFQLRNERGLYVASLAVRGMGAALPVKLETIYTDERSNAAVFCTRAAALAILAALAHHSQAELWVCEFGGE